MDMSSQLTPNQILDLVLDRSSFGNPEAFLQRFSSHLVKDFDPSRFFYGPVVGSFGHSHVVVQGGIAKSIVYDEARALYLAYFVKEETGWKLHSINWWCPACNCRGYVFNGSGSGIPNLCVVCGGVGWGDLGDFDICFAETGSIEIDAS
jgi:hypothetical protein